MNYKIINAILLLNKDGKLVTQSKDLYIKNNKILSVGKTDSINDSDFETVDAKGKLVMPGLINSHNHVYMTLLRNHANDVPFNEWLFNRIFPVEDKLTKEMCYWGSVLGCMEMIVSGTTSFVDMHIFTEQSCMAANLCGMRGFIGRGLVGEDLEVDGYSRFAAAIEEKEKFESDTLQFLLSPHAIYSTSEKLLKQINEQAKQRNMLKHIHLSESNKEVEDCYTARGVSPVEYLENIGFLDENTLLAHCVKLSDNDIEIIKQCKSSIVTNPASNSMLSNGFAPVTKMLDAGINVCLGTDGPASNNTLNMFREMGLLSIIHKGVCEDSTSLGANTVINMATVNGAKALGMENKLGEIKENALADLIFIDLQSPNLFPNNNIIASLCYSANGSEVDSVMINGKFVLKNREFVSVDKEQVYFEVSKITKELYQ